MNILFKSILIIGYLTIISQASSREIILIENTGSPQDGEMLVRILKEKFNIPESFIKINSKKICKLDHDAIMHLCLRSGAELDVLKVENYVIENMLKNFLEMEK